MPGQSVNNSARITAFPNITTSDSSWMFEPQTTRMGEQHTVSGQALQNAIDMARRAGRSSRSMGGFTDMLEDRIRNGVPELTVEDAPQRDTAQEESVFVEHIRMALGNGDPVSSKQAKKYIEIVKKHRHIDSMERRMLHNPKPHKVKKVCNCNVDDLCDEIKNTK